VLQGYMSKTPLKDVEWTVKVPKTKIGCRC